jgi:ketopantoate hydroxymethyltransferase
VRALFANYTGRHALFWRDGQLLVQHDSLGHSFKPQFSPLVVNLPAEQKEVFIHVGGGA